MRLPAQLRSNLLTWTSKRRQFSTSTYINTRLEKWEQEKRTQNATKQLQSQEISIHTAQFPSVKPIKGAHLTPLDVLKALNQDSKVVLPPSILCGRVNGNILWELTRPFATSSFEDHEIQLEFLNFESSEDVKHLFWHSGAHLLGQALEMKYGDDVLLCDGPALSDDGFFYEMYLKDGQTISDSIFKELESNIKQIIKQKQPFERMEVTRDVARDMFAYSTYKLQMLDKIPQNEPITLYKNGNFIDLCRGPHVPHTGVFNAVAMTRCGASHWNNSKDDLLQRVYGIVFPKKSDLKQWQELQEEAKKRDHRSIDYFRTSRLYTETLCSGMICLFEVYFVI